MIHYQADWRKMDTARGISGQTKLHLLISREEIDKKVRELAGKLHRDYRERCPILVGVLKGSFMFMADLVRCLDFPLEVEFVRVSSYGQGRVSGGKIEEVQGLRCKVADRDVLLVEDIVDTGLTTSFLFERLRQERPASLRLCALTDKPSRRKTPVQIDYLGFTIPDKFIVGYGVDWDEKYRNLPDIYFVED